MTSPRIPRPRPRLQLPWASSGVDGLLAWCLTLVAAGYATWRWFLIFYRF